MPLAQLAEKVRVDCAPFGRGLIPKVVDGQRSKYANPLRTDAGYGDLKVLVPDLNPYARADRQPFLILGQHH
jgi:hypothetical protein